MTKKYWCPMCGNVPAILVTHKADCIGFHAIPVVEPLDVPEVTTWGESGGAEALADMLEWVRSQPAGVRR
jgi:hypothetical protein